MGNELIEIGPKTIAANNTNTEEIYYFPQQIENKGILSVECNPRIGQFHVIV